MNPQVKGDIIKNESLKKQMVKLFHYLSLVKVIIAINLFSVFLPFSLGYASENFVVKSLTGDVYLLSSNNRWERVYEQEKLSGGFRIKTEKGSSVTITGGQEMEIMLLENSLFEVNDNFSQYSFIISSALFYGTAEFDLQMANRRLRVVTPYNILTATKGKFRLSTDSLHRTIYESITGKLYLVEKNDESLLLGSGLIDKGNNERGFASFSKIIINNIDIFKTLIEKYDLFCDLFDSLIEKRFIAKKTDSLLSKEIDQSISEIFNTVLQMSETKNRINMFSHFLKREVDEKSISNGTDDEDDILDILEGLKKRQDEINGLKKRYNNIISTELYQILKAYEITKNHRKNK